MLLTTRRLLLTVVLCLTASTVGRTQSLGEVAKAEAARRAALPTAGKVLGDLKPEPARPANAPETVVPSVDVPIAPAATASPAFASGTLTANQTAGAALLTDRLVALEKVFASRTQLAAQYRDACAGKETSAGWALGGALIATPNEETPVCRRIASDLERDTTAFDVEHRALTETARRAGIFPGVLRELFFRHGLPE
jgi:hypothetical protein